MNPLDLLIAGHNRFRAAHDAEEEETLLTKQDLMDLASQQEIPGRSKMSHDELAATVAPA